MQLNSKRLLKQNFHIVLEVPVFLNIVSQKEKSSNQKKKKTDIQIDCNALIWQLFMGQTYSVSYVFTS